MTKPGTTSSIQALCTYFEQYLTQRDSGGFCIADSRSKTKNLRVSHSIFTQKFGAASSYRRQVELPAFDHSDNHAGLEICDVVCFGLLYPIACFAYCAGEVNNVHVQSGASRLRRRYGQQPKELQHRYYDAKAGGMSGAWWCPTISTRGAAPSCSAVEVRREALDQDARPKWKTDGCDNVRRHGGWRCCRGMLLDRAVVGSRCLRRTAGGAQPMANCAAHAMAYGTVGTT